jgi:ABC-2 type transport system permease protein
MKMVLRQALIVARRDFIAVVGTPTFLLFLFAPLVMFAFAAASGTGAAKMAVNTANRTQIVAIVDGKDGEQLRKADIGLRRLYRDEDAPPRLELIKPEGDLATQSKNIVQSKDRDVTAVMFGPLERPHVIFQPPSDRHARYLSVLAEQVLRAERSGVAPDTKLSTPRISELEVKQATNRGKQASGFGAVFTIFFLTLLLAGQAVGMLAEEKSNKVIEILAAAVPLEAVFLGKLLGMFGVALLFIGFWGTLIGLGLNFVPEGMGLASLAPAIGLGPFLALCAAYFTMAFMLLGAVFLGVGAQASTMREIQMLSLPITIFQVAMFGLSSAAAGQPGTSLASFAQIFPFSSPFAMAARAATDGSIWPHLLALAWQALWVGLVIWISVRLFRIGVLKSGGGWRQFIGLSPSA